MTSPVALTKLGWFLMEARQHQSSRHKDVIMISPPNQGTWNHPQPPSCLPFVPIILNASPQLFLMLNPKYIREAQIELMFTGVTFACHAT